MICLFFETHYLNVAKFFDLLVLIPGSSKVKSSVDFLIHLYIKINRLEISTRGLSYPCFK